VEIQQTTHKRNPKPTEEQCASTSHLENPLAFSPAITITSSIKVNRALQILGSLLSFDLETETKDLMMLSLFKDYQKTCYPFLHRSMHNFGEANNTRLTILSNANPIQINPFEVSLSTLSYNSLPLLPALL
jgi:hypothetical protein